MLQYREKYRSITNLVDVKIVLLHILILSFWFQKKTANHERLLDGKCIMYTTASRCLDSWRIVSSTCSSLTWGLCRWLKMTASLKLSTPWTLVTLCRTCSHFCIAMQSVWTKGVRESKCVGVGVCVSVWEFVSVCVCKSVCVCECVHLRVCASAV